LEYYKAMMERAEKTLPIADIHSVESQDESIAIYHAAPYRLTLEDMAAVGTALRQLYRNHKHTMVSREVFLQECQALPKKIWWIISSITITKE
jgi:DNA-binding LytR/AlgR family response regulator